MVATERRVPSADRVVVLDVRLAEQVRGPARQQVDLRDRDQEERDDEEGRRHPHRRVAVLEAAVARDRRVREAARHLIQQRHVTSSDYSAS